VQSDITDLRRSHQDLRAEVRLGFDTVHRRFDTMEARLDTMQDEMRRFFRRYEHIDAERQP
jgi:hypothetical protein